MFWFIIIVIQIVLWWVTFFKTKKMKRTKLENRWGNKEWGEFSLTNERYKFALGYVVASLLACLIPFVGIIVIVIIHANNESKFSSQWGDTKPSFAIIELLKKEI